MSSDLVLLKTKQTELQPLNVGGLPVHQGYQQLREELTAALGAEHAELFAEPNADRVSGDIQWFAPMPGRAVRLADLPAQERTEAERALARLVVDITQHAGALRIKSTAAGRFLGETLALALEIPDERHIFVVEGRPVIAGWGHIPRGPIAPRSLLQTIAKRHAPPLPIGLGAGAAPPPATVIAAPAAGAGMQRLLFVERMVPAAAGGLGWLAALLWSLLALLLLIIGYLLLKHCAIAWPGGVDPVARYLWNYCEAEVTEAAPPPAVQPPSDDLLRERQALEEELERKRRECETARVEPPPVPPLREDTQRDIDRARGQGAGKGKVEVILTWNSLDDVDLRAICPDGTKIDYTNKSACGGNLDLDKNVSARDATIQPAEHIVWTSPAPGRYSVSVRLYEYRSNGVVPYAVTLLIDGREAKRETGALSSPNQIDEVMSFELPFRENP